MARRARRHGHLHRRDPQRPQAVPRQGRQPGLIAALALGLFALYFALAFSARMALQRHRTGSSGFKGISSSLGSVEWFRSMLFAGGSLVVGLASPALGLAGVVEPVATLDERVSHTLGVVLYLLGLVGTLAAQVMMGRSWRIGVDESEKTKLVTTGPFTLVRNPIFSAMVATFFRLALMAPNVLALTGFLALVTGVELQVRFVEEPYLTRTRGARYAEYTSRVGRFAPGLRRLKP